MRIKGSGAGMGLRTRRFDVEMGKILKFNRFLVARSIVSKAPQQSEEDPVKVGKGVRHGTKLKGLALIIM